MFFNTIYDGYWYNDARFIPNIPIVKINTVIIKIKLINKDKYIYLFVLLLATIIFLGTNNNIDINENGKPEIYIVPFMISLLLIIIGLKLFILNPLILHINTKRNSKKLIKNSIVLTLIIDSYPLLLI